MGCAPSKFGVPQFKLKLKSYTGAFAGRVCQLIRRHCVCHAPILRDLCQHPSQPNLDLVVSKYAHWRKNFFADEDPGAHGRVPPWILQDAYDRHSLEGARRTADFAAER